MRPLPAPFGFMPDGTAVELSELADGSLSMSVMPYGGIITALRAPDRQGRPGNVVLGHASFAAYLEQTSYLGALIGRYANRIAYGRVTIDGRAHQLATNDGPHHLHGGARGFDARLWHAAISRREAGATVTFTRMSADGEEHYPGNLHATVSYTIAADATVTIRYLARADAPTVVNLTQHTYFNLSGLAGRTILDHELTLYADAYTPVDGTLIPTGEVASVAGTPFDFRRPARIGVRLREDHPQLRAAGGFDHNFVLHAGGGGLATAALLRDPESGRTLEVWTTEPGVQFYDGHLLETPHAGLCLETQHFPDSPNRPAFPSTQLAPGETYESTTVWRFGCH